MLTVNYKDALYRSSKRTLIFNVEAYNRDKPKTKKALKESELRILEDLLVGLSNAEIAERLGVNKTTANARVKTVLRYFGATDQMDLLIWLVGEGYAMPAEQWRQRLDQSLQPPKPTREKPFDVLVSDYFKAVKSGREPTLDELSAKTMSDAGWDHWPTEQEVHAKNCKAKRVFNQLLRDYSEALKRGREPTLDALCASCWADQGWDHIPTSSEIFGRYRIAKVEACRPPIWKRFLSCQCNCCCGGAK